MLISTQTRVLAARFGLEGAIKRIAEAGFDAYDCSFFTLLDPNHPFSGENYLEEAKRIRAYADSLGIVCNQAHAPFPPYKKPKTEADIAYNADVLVKTRRAMEIASVLGAENIVIHPMDHRTYVNHREELWDVNYDFFKHTVQPWCEQYRIHAAIENIWLVSEYDGKIDESFLSRPDEMVRFLDALDSEWFVSCLDVGHAALIGCPPEVNVRTLGAKRLHALHLHDVDGEADLHTLPGLFKIDFNALIDALADIGYEGDLTLEADHFFERMPEECVKDASHLMASVTRSMANRFAKRLAEKNAK